MASIEMGELFDRYDAEFSSSAEKIRERIKAVQSFSGEKRKFVIAEAERMFEDMRELLNQMEQLSRNAARDKGRRMQAKYKTHSEEYTRLKRELERASLMSTTNNKDYGSDDPTVRDLDIRANILSSSNVLDQSEDRLHNIHKITLETEEVGTNVLKDMHGQRQQLENANTNLDTINDNMVRGRRILSGMGRRVVTNKVILVFVILVLFAANCIIVYFKWIAPLLK